MMTYPFTGGVLLNGTFNILSALTHLTQFISSLINLSGEQHDCVRAWKRLKRFKGPGLSGKGLFVLKKCLMK